MVNDGKIGCDNDNGEINEGEKSKSINRQNRKMTTSKKSWKA